MFALVVDDFGVKYVREEHAKHLLDILLANYGGVHEDWGSTKFCGITLKWDYIRHTCKLSMPGYIEAILSCFHHPRPIKPELSPHQYASCSFSTSNAQAPIPDNYTARLDTSGVLRVQRVVGCILYYARAIYSPLLPALTEIGSNQTNATEETLAATKKILNFVATFPNAVIWYVASDMCLWIDSDTSFASIPNARSRVGGIFYLSPYPSKSPKNIDPPLNGPIYVLYRIMKIVLSSASESEYG